MKAIKSEKFEVEFKCYYCKRKSFINTHTVPINGCKDLFCSIECYEKWSDKTAKESNS